MVITGDTIKDQNIVEMSRGVDLLVHEALADNLVGLINEGARRNNLTNMMKITHDIPDYHATPRDAAETAAEAGSVICSTTTLSQRFSFLVRSVSS